MIEIKNITKTFGEVFALRDVSFKINEKEILGLLGPNGAGKTTLMRILTGYLLQDRGSIIINNKELKEVSIEIKKIIGYLPENNPLYEDMSVYEYLSFIAELRDVPTSRIKEVVEICNIKDVLLKNISELSKGYRQRVGFAQAILHDPKILILDEPTSGLDPNQAAEVKKLIKEFKREKTIILSTHILSEVEEVADRVVIIHKGQIVLESEIENLQENILKKNIFEIEGKFNKNLEEYLPSCIDGIYRVSLISDNDGIRKYEIETEKDKDIREEIFKLAVKENWVLLELHKTGVSLQEIFKELTQN